MTDFFTSLVDRALDRTPVLERRQPPLFEPVADTPIGKRAGLEDESPLEEEEILRENKPGRAERKYSVNRLPQEPQQREQVESQPVEAGPVSRAHNHDNPVSPHDRVTARVEPVVTTTKNESVKEVSSEEPARESRTRIAAEPEQRAAVTPVRSIETIVERRVEREIIKAHSADQPVVKEVHTVTQTNEQSKPSRKNDGEQSRQSQKAEVKQLTPPIERRTNEPSIRQKPVPSGNQPAIKRAAARADAKDSSKQATAPVIHVTIGRVEVRATPPPANKSRVAQRAGPKLSLEDYLRARGEGK